jgi:hypothetical protein
MLAKTPLSFRFFKTLRLSLLLGTFIGAFSYAISFTMLSSCEYPVGAHDDRFLRGADFLRGKDHYEIVGDISTGGGDVLHIEVNEVGDIRVKGKHSKEVLLKAKFQPHVVNWTKKFQQGYGQTPSASIEKSYVPKAINKIYIHRGFFIVITDVGIWMVGAQDPEFVPSPPSIWSRLRFRPAPDPLRTQLIGVPFFKNIKPSGKAETDTLFTDIATPTEISFGPQGLAVSVAEFTTKISMEFPADVRDLWEKAGIP